MRFLRRSGSQDRYWRPALKDAELRKLDKRMPLVDGDHRQGQHPQRPQRRRRSQGDGRQGARRLPRASSPTCLDVEKRGHAMRDFWEPIHASKDGQLILDPDEFYILASRSASTCRRVRRRDGAVRPAGGRVPRPLCRLLRSGLRPRRGGRRRLQGGAGGAQPRGAVRPGARPDHRAAGLRAAGRPARQDSTAGHHLNYQGQGLKLSKHFR